MGFLGLGVLEDDHGADRVSPLDVGYVVALDSPGRVGQAQRFLQLGHGGIHRGSVRQLLDTQLFETLRGILGDHLHQTPFLAALRHVDANAALPFLAQPLHDAVRFFEAMLHEDARRHIRRGVVELLHECREYLVRLVVLRSRHQEVVPTNELALTDEEDLHPSLTRSGSGRNHVGVLRGQVQHLLALIDLFDCRELVAQNGSFLELKAVRGFEHALLD